MDYPVIQVEGVSESADFVTTGLPLGVRSMSFTSTATPYAKSGIFNLIQLAVLILLRTPGRDKFSPGVGGGLKGLLGLPVGESLLNTRKSQISLAVARTEEHLTAVQANAGAPPEERLSSFTLVDAAFDYAQQTWNVIVRLVSDAGGAADVLL